MIKLSTIEQYKGGNMLIGITKKIQDKYKYIKLETIEERPELLFCWHASKFTYDRKTGLQIMNDLTRYSVVLYDIKKKEIENITKIFKSQLKSNLLHDGIDEIRIQKYLNDLSDVEFTKTSSRSILGQLNDSLYLLEGIVQDADISSQVGLDYINKEINDVPMTPLEKLGYVPFPNHAMRSELNKVY